MRDLRFNLPSRKRSLAVLIAAVMTAAIIGAVAFGAVQASTLHTESERRHDRAQALRAVRAEVLALTNISATTTDKQIDALLAGMTEHLKGEFAPQAGAFREEMVQSQVQSHGRIVAVGLTSINPRRATAIVAAVARVSNERTAEGQDRSYRLSLSLKKVDERWLVDSMDFVP